MNNKSDFHKKSSGVVVNTNSRDFRRARRRNFTNRENDKIIGKDGKVAKLEKEVSDLKDIVSALLTKLEDK